MVTVPEASKKIIERSRYLTEAISKDLINISSLARYIKPEVDQMLIKKVSVSSVIMAIKRLKNKLKPQIRYSSIFKRAPEMILRSNLAALYATESKTLPYDELLEVIEKNQKSFFTVTRNVTEVTIIASDDLQEKIRNILAEEEIIAEFTNLASITVRLPTDAITTPGIYYFFLKSLAWEGINIIEIVSTAHELTLLFDDKDVEKAFSMLKSLF